MFLAPTLLMPARKCWIAVLFLTAGACSSTSISSPAENPGDASDRRGDSSDNAGDSSSTTAPAARDPRCPASVPSAGDSCDPSPAPLECEYGGDAHGRCTTTASCVSSSPSGPFAFRLDTSSNCPPNRADCPAAFGTEPKAGSCLVHGLSCTYDEGVCGCICAQGAVSWKCRTRSDVATDVAVIPRPDVIPQCSAMRPLVGDACPLETQMCSYATYCTPETSLGPSLQCRNGYWEVMPNNGACTRGC